LHLSQLSEIIDIEKYRITTLRLSASARTILEHYLKKIIFKSSSEVFEWLSGFINLERGQKPKSFRLDRMEYLCELAGNPQRCAPSIHIAGSKGKGSVTSMLAAILAETGFRVSRYMSPHVSDFRERICLNGSFFSEEIYLAAGCELRHLTEESLPAFVKSHHAAAALFDPSADGGCEPTYWELLTLYFFLCSRLSGCDIMVVETGLGGRLDSTNIIDPLISVITLIELEHTNFLGGTITEIAGEKAGIIKKGKPVILAEQRGEALEVFKKKAEEIKSPLYYFPEILKLTDINVTSQGTSFALSAVGSSSDYISNLNGQRSLAEIFNSSFFIPIPGKVQAENAALSIIALQTAFPQIKAETIKNGLLKTRIPARFEKISDEPVIIIDGAHTEESFSLCAETFHSLYGEGGILIFGCASDKNPAAMAKAASGIFEKIIITTPGTFKSSNPENVYKIFSESIGKDKVILIKDTQEAVRQALSFSKKELGFKQKSLPVLGAGSFYLVSEIRKFVLSE